MTDPALSPLLGRLRHDLSERQWSDFFDDIYHLGLALGIEPRLGVDPELARFIEDTVPVLREHHVDLMFFPGEVVRRFQGIWEYNEWERLCAARSGLQFFVDLFGKTALAENLSDFDTGYVDDLIREMGREGHLTDDEIPHGVPRSHWWWWHPRQTA